MRPTKGRLISRMRFEFLMWRALWRFSLLTSVMNSGLSR